MAQSSTHLNSPTFRMVTMCVHSKNMIYSHWLRVDQAQFPATQGRIKGVGCMGCCKRLNRGMGLQHLKANQSSIHHMWCEMTSSVPMLKPSGGSEFRNQRAAAVPVEFGRLTLPAKRLLASIHVLHVMSVRLPCCTCDSSSLRVRRSSVLVADVFVAESDVECVKMRGVYSGSGETNNCSREVMVIVVIMSFKVARIREQERKAFMYLRHTSKKVRRGR